MIKCAVMVIFVCYHVKQECHRSQYRSYFVNSLMLYIKNRWPFPYSSVLATIQLHLVHRVYSKFMLAWVFVRTTVCLSMRCCLMYAGTASLVCGIKRPEYETILPRKRYPNHTNNILFSKHNKSSKKPKPWLKFYPPKLYGSHFVIIFP